MVENNKTVLKQDKDTDIPVMMHNGSQYHSPTENYFCKQSSVDDSHASLPPFTSLMKQVLFG